jgi:hypothetical protein
MPGIQAYEVLLDFTNDTLECATVQLLRDYGRNTGAIVFLHPGENVTLVLDAGSVYRYALKMHSKVADVTCVICSCCIGGHTCSRISSLETELGHGETSTATYRVCSPAVRLAGRLHIWVPHFHRTELLLTDCGGIIGSNYRGGMSEDITGGM